MELPSESGEARILTQRVEPGIDPDGDEIEAPILARLRQPLESEIEVAERELNPRELQRRHVALGRVGLELLQHVKRVLPFARQREGPSERAMHPRGLRRQMDRALECGQRLVEILALFLNHAENP